MQSWPLHWGSASRWAPDDEIYIPRPSLAAVLIVGASTFSVTWIISRHGLTRDEDSTCGRHFLQESEPSVYQRVLACIRHHIGDIRRVLACISSGPVIEFSSLRSQLEFMPIYNSHRQCSLIPSKHVLLSYYFSTASSTLASSHGKELGRMVGLRVESGCLGLECQGGPQ